MLGVLRSLSNYENLLSQLVAIIVASLMDLLTDDSMSIRATEALERFLEALAEALQAFPLGRRDDARSPFFWNAKDLKISTEKS